MTGNNTNKLRSKIHIKLILAVLFLSFGINTVYGQGFKHDTLKFTLPEAEKTFLQNNLLLLAQKYNVDASKALILQARLWPNPYFGFDQGAYNTQNKKWFQTDSNGETAAQLSQLIMLAGKIRKQVDIAKTNALIAEFTLYDVLRTLKFTLRNDFYNIYYLQQTAKVYDEEINALKKIVVAFDAQSSKGYIAQTEVVRIKAQLYNLQSEYNDLLNQLYDKQSEIRLLLQVAPTAYVVPQVDTLALNKANPLQYPMAALIDSAYHNRTDLNIAKANVTLSQQNLTYQKALAIPDITVSLGYDKNGSYIHNFNSAGLSFSIPLFNRNQGNIKSARSMIDYNNMTYQSTQKTVEEQVTRALQKAMDADKIFKDIDPTFSPQFDRLAKAVLDNYMKRNIALLDFLNFYDSYKQNIVQVNYIAFNRISALESINFLTGTSFFNK